MLINVNASICPSVRQTKANECSNPNGNTCLFIVCENGGQCIDDPTTADCFKCQCSSGYTGKMCDTPLTTFPSKCNSECQNGGKCELIAGNIYGCVCREEFTGTQCETSILINHPCITMPTSICQNGGVCTIHGLDYRCKCATGWSGTNCQTKDLISSCNPSPCGIHGTCFEVDLPIGLTAYCTCENRWTGKYCDVNIDDANCPTGYCLAGGTCIMNGNIPYCICPPLYTGQQCQSLVDALATTTTTTTSTTPIIINVGSCLSNPCLHEGTCLTGSNNFICVCKLPWTGLTCAIDGTITTIPILTTTTTVSTTSSACSSNPCKNGATCLGNNDAYRCVCPPLWSGIVCDQLLITVTTTDITTTITSNSMTCANQPCKNGGTCVPVGNSYSCFCGLSTIYNGKNCDSTTPMTTNECPLNCAPGRCIFSGYSQRPYACLWNGIMRPSEGTTG
ncbi:unnamed protein product [Adineta steineri]|uniref:EGF-like domain-containing protein n=1 Tax=Adineta steineri TaxID=433720 RepID=A0A813PKM3_9BILA|nr:unnamed protein product [Adineta steineri]CAF0740270.1 unnamed protein product [Adineta steineri]CAF0750197.1 unnamed protein product [Adineta steineri]